MMELNLAHHPIRSQDGDHTDGNNNNADDGPPKTPAAIPSATFTPHGQKQESMANSIIEVSAHERENCTKITKINAAVKTECSNQWETLKWHTNMELELAHLQHQQNEAAAQCAHETAMFDWQAALEMARAGQGGYGTQGVD